MRALGFIGIVIASALAGCSQNTQSLVPSAPNPPVADVPIPLGMHIDLGRSQSTYVPGSGVRLVNELYTGSVPRLSVARFFLHNMPDYKWKMQEERQGPSEISLDFIKHHEECVITIKRGWFSTHCYVLITPATPKAQTTQPAMRVSP
jgi:hypothetical protein